MPIRIHKFGFRGRLGVRGRPPIDEVAKPHLRRPRIERPGPPTQISRPRGREQYVKKQSLWIPAATVVELQREAHRLETSMSRILQEAWRLAQDDVKKYPTGVRYAEKKRQEVDFDDLD